MKVTYNCEWCGSTATRRRSPANMPVLPRFCSQACNGASRKGLGSGPRPNHHFDCGVCGKPCSVYRSPGASLPRFCSVRCTRIAQLDSGNPAYSGGRVGKTSGYVLVLTPSHPRADPRGYVYEHRLVMERAIGRLLAPGEVVHHRNRIRDDNRIENLQLFASHSDHMKLHARENAA